MSTGGQTILTPGQRVTQLNVEIGKQDPDGVIGGEKCDPCGKVGASIPKRIQKGRFCWETRSLKTK